MRWSRHKSDTSHEAPPSGRRWSIGRTLALFSIAIVASIAIVLYWSSTQSALDFLLARAVERSEGRLSVEGAKGSLMSTVHVDRLTWRGDDVKLVATTVLLTWSPTDLLSRRFHVVGFGAQTLEVELPPATGPTQMPSSLALPLDVSIAHGGIGRITWRSGDAGGVVTGLKFTYAGGDSEHRFRDIELIGDRGAFTGAVTVAAKPPFGLSGQLSFHGEKDLSDASAEGSVTGKLEDLTVEGNVTLRGARGDGAIRIAPFATVPLVSARLKLADVDLQRFAGALPATHLDVALTASPVSGGFSGVLDASNAQSGAIDVNQVPVSTLHTRVAWVGDVIDFTEMAATLQGGAQVRGSAHYDVRLNGARFDLRVANVDLHRIHGSMVTTALSGTLAGDADAKRQTLRGSLEQSDLRFDFDASVAQRVVEVNTLHARAGAGELDARGRFVLDTTRAFRAEGSVKRFDPARFVKMPAGNLDARFKAEGALSPAWRVSAEADIAPGSMLAATAVAGRLAGEASARELRNAQIDLRVAGGDIKVAGNAGRNGDRLDFTVALPDVGPLRKMLSVTAPDAVPEQYTPSRGALNAHGALFIAPGGIGADVDAEGKSLQWTSAYSVANAKASIALPAPAPVSREGSDARSVRASLRATDVRIDQRRASSASLEVAGTMAQHRIVASAAGEGADIRVRLEGGFRGSGATAREHLPWPWAGNIGLLENAGEYALALKAPATLEVSPGSVRVASAQLAIAGGNADIDEFAWKNGRVTSSGRFAAVPLAALAQIAGRSLPMRSTLTLQGDWSVAATPRLEGNVRVRREGGDIYASGVDTVDAARALGIETLSLDARFASDTLAMQAQFRSARGGNADGTLTVAAPSGSPSPLFMQAPMTGSLTAELSSLRLLQPFVGTVAAIDGRARANISAKGSLAQPSLAGDIAADDVRIDLPQYGAQYKDGRVRARLAGDRIFLDEMSLAAGDGRFEAKGTLAAAPASGVVPDVTWHAENFRLFNRPSLRLVVAGDGSLRLDDKRLLLAGRVRIEEGRIIYEPAKEGRLADDVVVIGRARPAPTSVAASVSDLPLRLDLEVETASSVTFAGEGLDTLLSGNIHLTTLASGGLTSKGTIRTSKGTYYAVGQKLTIDRGRLIFDGPVDNPALDVVALRKNLAVEAGVEITGTVKLPRVRLVSEPPVPDNEKLAWLLTGQPLDRASRADLAILASASASLLSGRGQKPITQTIAQSVGLDDISVHESSISTATGTTSGQVVQFGKRLSDRLSLVYEQGLNIATNALRIEYALTRTVTLRAEAGTVGSLGVYYRRSFD